MSAASARDQFHLPPLPLSDFVIHYRNADFHVHTFVLHHHSAYFRTYLDNLQPLEAVTTELTGKKRKSYTVDLPSSSERSVKCSHSPLIRCIDLLDQCGIEAAHEKTFLLFLQHLYFSSTLHCPPFAPKAELCAALTDSTPTCFAYPTCATTKEELLEYGVPAGKEYSVSGEANSLNWFPPLLSLFHYFDCQQAMKRCEAVIAGSVIKTHPTWAWFWLPYTVRYSLKEAEQRCIEEVVKDKELRLEDAQYKERLQKLTRGTLLRLLEAFAKR